MNGTAPFFWAAGALALLALGMALRPALRQPAGVRAADPRGAPSRRAGLVLLLAAVAALGIAVTTPAPKAPPDSIEGMVASLAERLARQPSDLAGWLMLARSYEALRRYRDAADAYGRASALAPNDAQILADQADTLAMAQGGRAAGEPEQLIARALALAPDHPKALALAGSAAIERGDRAAAARYLDRANLQLPAGETPR